MGVLHQQIEVDVRNQVMSQYESQVAAYDQMVRSRQAVSDGVAADSEAAAEAEARVNRARERLVASYGEQFVSDMDGMSADDAMGQFQFMDEAARGMARDYLDAKASLAALAQQAKPSQESEGKSQGSGEPQTVPNIEIIGVDDKEGGSEKPSQESGEPQRSEPQTALQRIPLHPETGEPMFEQAESVDAAWDALVEFSEGDASSAKVIADTMVEEKRKAFEKAQKLKPKGKTPAEILASQKANAAELAKAQAEFEYWQKMAAVEQNRKAAMRSQQEAEAASGQVSAEANVQSADERQSNLQSSEEIDANLSEEEKDEYGKPLVLAKDGTTTFGIIDAETGLTEAPIRLSLGENTTDNEGKNHGYGLLHIEAGHGDQIRNAGYASVEEFVEEVAKNYTDIREGALIGENQTYLLEVSDDHNNTLFIQLSNDGTYWNVNSAGIFRKRYSRRNPKVYDRPALSDGKSTDTTEVNSSQTEGATAPAGNSSQTSAGKDSESLAEEQISTSTSSEVDPAEPTEGQKKAGNYKMEHRRVDGYDISIENKKGSIRRGKDANGKEWESEMHNDYGYIRGTEGVDGDHIDVFLSESPEQGNVYVVDQYNPDGSFDEHKVMYGFADGKAAREAYLSNYEQGWDQSRRLDVTGVSKDEFKKWIQSSKRKTKPFAEYKNVAPIKSETNNLFGYFNGTLHELISKAKESATGLIKKIIAPTSERLRLDLSDKGVEIDDSYKHVIDNNAIRHTLKNHGSKSEEKRGQVPVTEEDFGRLEDVVTNYDKIEVEIGKRGNENILYSKTYEDGTTIFVEEKRVGRKELAAVTMWKIKNPTRTDANHTEATQISDLSRISDGKVNTLSSDKQESSEESVADRIEALFDDAVAGKLTGKPVEVGRLTAEGKSYLEKLSGKQMKDVVSFMINPSDMVHIYRRHFGKNEKDGRNYPLTKADVRMMHAIVCNPDRVLYGVEKNGQSRGMFFFLKDTGGGSYNLMEVYSDGKGNLTAKSFFKSKEGVSQRAMLLNESSTLTSVTDGATLLEGAKLPKFFEYPKSEAEEDLRVRDGSDVHGAIEEYKRKYPSAEITVIASEGEIAELPVVEEIKNGLKELHSDAETLAAYCRVDKKIYIFAGRNQAGEIEESLLHENIHAVCDRLSGAEYELLSSIAEKLSAVTEGGNILGRLYSGIVSAYDRKDVAEEMIVYSLQYARKHPEIMDSIYETLDEAERDLIENKILKEVYGREEGREEDVYRGEGERLQQDDGSDQRERVGGVGERTGAVVAEDAWGRDWGESQRLIDEAESAAAAEHQAKVDRIRELSERLHLDNVDIVADGSGLSGRRAKAKGWYNRRTGRITIVVGNNVSVADVERTLLHEAVAHYGLRQLLGSRFEGFLDDVYASASAQVRARIVELAKSRGWDFRTATEEYLAGLAEDMAFERHGAERGWWDRVKEMFCRLLGDIGFKSFIGKGVELSDSELRYMLWSSYEHLRDPANYRSVMGEAADVAMQSELQVGEFAAEVSEESLGMEAELESENARFNEQLSAFADGSMAANEFIDVGQPTGVLRMFMPELPIILRQKVLRKALNKHGMSTLELLDLPQSLAHPIFVFKKTDKTIGVLTSLKASNGKNVFVAIELEVSKQMGHQVMSVNDVLSVHDREYENVVLPILENGTLQYVDKIKGLDWLSSAKTNSQAIASQTLEDVAKIVEKFENPAVEEAENEDASIGGTLFDPKGYISDVNVQFNEQLASFTDGSMAANEFIDWPPYR